jgi:hypothetical protein
MAAPVAFDLRMRSATDLIFGMLPTDVPPYFWTMMFMES